MPDQSLQPSPKFGVARRRRSWLAYLHPLRSLALIRMLPTLTPSRARFRAVAEFALVRQTMECFMKTKGSVPIFVLILLLFCTSTICAADGFDSVRCGSDIRQALLGRTMSNEKIVALEERHKDLGLKDLGGTEISDRLFLISWRICGEEYFLLEDHDIVRDVQKFPKHSKDSPQFIGGCQLNGHDLPGTAIGVLKNEAGVEILPAVIAWKIDEKQMKFVKLQTDGLRCSREGIITVDGGR